MDRLSYTFRCGAFNGTGRVRRSVKYNSQTFRRRRTAFPQSQMGIGCTIVIMKMDMLYMITQLFCPFHRGITGITVGMSHIETESEIGSATSRMGSISGSCTFSIRI